MTHIPTKINNLFNDNYRTISEASSNIEEFKNNFFEKFKQDPELFSNFNNFKDYFENLLNFYSKFFVREMELKEYHIKEKFINFFSKNFNEINAISKSGEEFEKRYKEKLDIIPELKYNYDKYKDFYNNLLKEKYDTFLIFLKMRKEKEKLEEEIKINQFFDDNYLEIRNISSTEEEFLSNFEKKKLSNKELHQILNKHKKIYDMNLNKKLIQFKEILKYKINEFIESYYNEVLKISNTKDEFVYNMRNKASKKFKNNDYFNMLLNKKVNDYEIDKKK